MRPGLYLDLGGMTGILNPPKLFAFKKKKKKERERERERERVKLESLMIIFPSLCWSFASKTQNVSDGPRQ